MPDVGSDQSWATSQLVEFLGVLSAQSDEASALRAGVERVLESLDAEIGMLMADHTPTVVVGLPPATPAAGRDGGRPGGRTGGDAGRARRVSHRRRLALSVGAGAPRLVIARLGTQDFEPTELLLLRGMAWVLELAQRQFAGMSALNERQRVLEHLSRIQRGIAARVPLAEVFDTVTESALSLVGSELAVLHVLDRDGLAVVSVSGTAPELRPPAWALRLSGGVAEEVYERDDLVRSARTRMRTGTSAAGPRWAPRFGRTAPSSALWS
jgi:hypothetical protein